MRLCILKKETGQNQWSASSRKSLGATNPRKIKLGIQKNSQENTELQFGKSCLILESLKVNIFLITYGYRHWTCSTSIEPHLQYLVALCFEKTKFISYVRLSTLKTCFKFFRISGLAIFIHFLETTQNRAEVICGIYDI